MEYVHVALVGHDGQHTAPGADRGGGGLGQPVGPPLARQRLPHRAGGAAVPKRGEKLFTPAVFGPRRAVDGSDGRGWGFDGCFLLDVGVPRRNGKPEHVGAGARVTSGNGVDKAAHFRGQHTFGGNDPVEPAQLPDMVCLRASFKNECVDQAAVEAHPHPHPGLRIVGLLGGYEIVELAVQVRHRQHRKHPGNRFVLRRGLAHTYRLADVSDVRPKKKPAVIKTNDVA